MADKEDLERLHSGEKDLSHCDFRDARLNDLDLSDRNFKNSKLDRVNITGSNLKSCDLSGVSFTSMVAENADLSGVRLKDNLIAVNLRGANLSNADLQNIRMVKTDLTGANIKGANFGSAKFGEDVIFNDVKFNSATNFDGAEGLRYLSRLPPFEDYDYENGIFRRKSPPSKTLEAESATIAISGGEATFTISDTQPTASTSIIEISSETVTPKLDHIRLQLPKILVTVHGLESQLSNAIDELNSEKPNDSSNLEKWEEKHELLKNLHDGIQEIKTSILKIQTPEDVEIESKEVQNLLEELLEEFELWIREHKPELVDWVSRLSLSSAFIGLMGLCGAYMPLATAAVLAVVGGEKVVKAIKNIQSGD